MPPEPALPPAAGYRPCPIGQVPPPPGGRGEGGWGRTARNGARGAPRLRGEKDDRRAKARRPHRRPSHRAWRMTAAPVLDASGVAKRYGAVAALRNASLSVRPRRGPRADGRERRRQVHPRQDPDRRRPPRLRHHPRRRPAPRHPLARLRPPRRPGAGLPGAGADPRPRRRRQPPPDRHAGRALPRLDPRPRHPRPRPLATSPATCPSPSSASSTSPAPSPTSPTSSSSTR